MSDQDTDGVSQRDLEDFFRYFVDWLATRPPHTRKWVLDDMRIDIEHRTDHLAGPGSTDEDERLDPDVLARARRLYQIARTTLAAAEGGELP